MRNAGSELPADERPEDIVSDSPRRYVLDSFAILALLCGEAGGTDVRALLGQATAGEASLWMSVINLGEVLYLTERRSGPEAAAATLGFMEQLAITVVDADREAVERAARVKAVHSVSYADAFAISLAQEHRAVVVTGDPEFRTVEEVVHVRWLRRQVEP